MVKKKEYIIVKAYPNSPSVGKTISWSEYDEQYIDEYCAYYSEKELQNKEFFELVEEKYYEILEFTRVEEFNKGELWSIQSNKKYNTSSGNYYLTLDEMMYEGCCVEDGSFVISKVKRLKDEVEISLGDKLKLPSWKEYLKVIEIKFENNTMKFHLEESNERGTFSACYSQLDLVKEPKVLFVTEDGLEYTEEPKVYYIVHSGLRIGQCETYKGWNFYDKECKRFSSKEKAQAFVDSKNEERLLDSKVLSYNSVVQLLDGYYLADAKHFKLKLKELVKSKQ